EHSVSNPRRSKSNRKNPFFQLQPIHGPNGLYSLLLLPEASLSTLFCTLNAELLLLSILPATENVAEEIDEQVFLSCTLLQCALCFRWILTQNDDDRSPLVQRMNGRRQSVLLFPLLSTEFLFGSPAEREEKVVHFGPLYEFHQRPPKEVL